MGSIVWNGVSSRAIPLVVENPPHYVSAEREYDPQHVPGRNGDLLIASDTFKNVERSYDVAFGSLEKSASELAAATSEWLRSANGYARLEDSYEPDYYRMAFYQQESDFEDILGHLGRGTITFNCMPQRFLKSGDTVLSFDLTGIGLDSGSKTFIINNPTSFVAYPEIFIFGKGTIRLMSSETTCQLDNVDQTIKIDGQKQGCYLLSSPQPNVHANIWAGKYVNANYDPFMALSGNKGITVMVLSGGFTRMEVIPRWYTI